MYGKTYQSLHGYKKAKELIDKDQDYQQVVQEIKKTHAV